MSSRADNTPVAKVGNLTGDPELRTGSSGKRFARLRVAVNTPVTPGDWKGEQRTDYYDVTAFDSLGEHAAQSLRRGDRVVLIGRGELRTWTDRNGTERTEKQIVADAIGPDLRFASVTVRRAARTASAEEKF